MDSGVLISCSDVSAASLRSSPRRSLGGTHTEASEARGDGDAEEEKDGKDEEEDEDEDENEDEDEDEDEDEEEEEEVDGKGASGASLLSKNTMLAGGRGARFFRASLANRSADSFSATPACAATFLKMGAGKR